MQINNDLIENVIATPILTIILFVVCYSHLRAIRRGKPLTNLQKQMLTWTCIFCFGAGYSIVFKDFLSRISHWGGAWLLTTAIWAALVTSGFWFKKAHAAARYEKM
jgi:hypothetical protein